MPFSFQEALNQPVTGIERPPLPPLGHYTWAVAKVPVITERGDYEIVEFPMQAVAAGDDVDQDELKTFGSLKKVNLRRSFLFDKTDEVAAQATLFNLRTFIEKHLLVEYPDNATLKQVLNTCVNARCIGQLTYRPDKNDPQVQYAEIRRTAPVE